MRHFWQSFGKALRAQRHRISLGIAAIIAALGATMTAAMRQQTPADTAASGQSIIYVDDNAPPLPLGDGRSWKRAFRHLQDALDAALASDGIVTEIRIAGGVYRPDQGANVTPGDRYATFNAVDGVALRGGYRGTYRQPTQGTSAALDPDARDIAAFETILSGDLLGNDGPNPWQNYADNAYILVNVIDESVIIDGFTFTAKNWEPEFYGDFGALHAENSQLRISQCSFRWNRGYIGGGLSVSDSVAAIDNCTFLSNRAYYGGGMHIHRSIVTTSHCRFQLNSTQAHHGGGVFATGGSSLEPSTLEFTDCEFSHNGVESKGAALYINTGHLVLARCVFRGNAAEQGAALYFTSANLPNAAIQDCRFESNHASTAGGAVWADPHIPLAVRNCAFADNFCSWQGGAAIVGAGDFVNCVFVHNICGGFENGGALRLRANSHVTNCLFNGNDSWGPGAGACIEPGQTATFAQCTFTSNITAAVGSAIEGNAVIHNSVVWNNTPLDVQVFGATDVRYSCVQGGALGAGNIDVDPLFRSMEGLDNVAGTSDDDLRLSPGSRCADSADNSLLPPDHFDLDGDGNRLEPLSLDLQMGSRIADDPLARDRGVAAGLPWIVDMGCFESARSVRQR